MLNITLNHFNPSKSNFNCFNQLASNKLNKSNQTNFQCNLTNQTYHPAHQLSLPWPSVSCSLYPGFALSKFFTDFFSSTLYRILWPVVLSATWYLFRTAPRSQNLLQKVSSNFTCLQKVS